jgi:hypothetical protein
VTHLVVTIRFQGAVVEHRIVRLREAMRLGEARGSAVSFPFATLVVQRDPLGWTVGGHRLVPGRSLVLGFGDFEVSLEGVVEDSAVFTRDLGPDLRLLVATVAVLLAAAWWDVMYRVASDNPELAAQVRAYLVAPGPIPVDATPAPEGGAEEGWSPAVGFASEAPEG